MNEAHHQLLGKILAVYDLQLSAAEDLPRFFSTLTVDEKAEVFLAKKGLFRPVLKQTKTFSGDTEIPNQIIDFATFLISIDMAKRPSHYLHRKLEIDEIPDFAKAFAQTQKRRPRRREQKSIIEKNFMGHIAEWKSDGLGLRKIAKSISKSPIGISISHTTLSKIYKEISSENTAELLNKKEPHEHE